MKPWRVRAGDVRHGLRHLLRQERNSPNRYRHLGLWRHGFASYSRDAYDFSRNGFDAYLSDFATPILTRRIADQGFTAVLANKLIFHEVLVDAFEPHLPRLFGIVIKGRFYERVDGEAYQSGAKLTSLLADVGRLVAKPVDGTQGKGVQVLSDTPSGLLRNGRPVTQEAVEALCSTWDQYIVTEFVEQHPYARAIFPGAANTIRVPVIRDPAFPDEAILPAAVHRFGTARSAPVDNRHAGGLACGVDPDTGRLSQAVNAVMGGARRNRWVEWLDAHPDTGTRFSTMSVARWEEVKQLVLAVSRTLPFLPYVGWDVIVTERGPVLIEGNDRMNPQLLQLHRPLLADPGMRALCERYGILGRRPFRDLLPTR